MRDYDSFVVLTPLFSSITRNIEKVERVWSKFLQRYTFILKTTVNTPSAWGKTEVELRILVRTINLNNVVE